MAGGIRGKSTTGHLGAWRTRTMGQRKWETAPRKTEGGRELPIWCPGVRAFPPSHDKGACKAQGLCPGPGAGLA